MNRCLGFTKNNNNCRAKIGPNKMFCCSNHEPINKELIDGCCFMCMEKVISPKDIIFFKCKHAFHKECYFEWITYSKEETPICLICRTPVLLNNTQKNKDKNILNIDVIDNISYILNKNNMYTGNNTNAYAAGMTGNNNNNNNNNTNAYAAGMTGSNNTNTYAAGMTGSNNTYTYENTNTNNINTAYADISGNNNIYSNIIVNNNVYSGITGSNNTSTNTNNTNNDIIYINNNIIYNN